MFHNLEIVQHSLICSGFCVQSHDSDFTFLSKRLYNRFGINNGEGPFQTYDLDLPLRLETADILKAWGGIQKSC